MHKNEINVDVKRMYSDYKYESTLSGVTKLSMSLNELWIAKTNCKLLSIWICPHRQNQCWPCSLAKHSKQLSWPWKLWESMLLEVQCEVSTVSDDLGCHVICWCWSTVFSEVHSQRSHLPGNFRALHASFCWQALWRCWFHFPAGLGTCPHCQRYQKLVQWPWFYCAWLASKLAWPELHRESMGYCQEEDERHQTQQCRWPEGHCQRNLGFHTTSAVPHTDHPPCHAELRQ